MRWELVVLGEDGVEVLELEEVHAMPASMGRAKVWLRTTTTVDMCLTGARLYANGREMCTPNWNDMRPPRGSTLDLCVNVTYWGLTQ